MLFLSKQNTNNKRISFNDWANQNNASITSELIDAGRAFLTEHAQQLKSPLSNLILDNRWHYLDKPKKESYRGTLETNNNGAPQLNLSYHSFRSGGMKARFDSRAIIKELWIQALNGVIKPVIKPKPSPIESPIESTQASLPVIDYLANDLAHWNALPSSGVSHYLAKKGLKDVLIPGIRFAPLHIAVAIVNTQGKYQGLQKIYNDGSKRFTKGLAKKGHFALIGLDAMPDKLTTIHLCEGIATAASLYLSLKQPIFAALDAFNLLPVAKALKAKYPKTQIIIWADNDWQKANKLRPDGKSIGNTGLIQAHNAAFKLRNTLVCAPDFSIVLPASLNLNSSETWKQILNKPMWVIRALQDPAIMALAMISTLEQDLIIQEERRNQATDFNDLHQLAGLSALATVIPMKPDIAIGLTKELEAFNQHHFGVLSHNNFSLSDKYAYHSRYLPSIPFNPGVHLVKSAIGTGKTAVVEDWIKAHPEQSVLFTTHLISLVESAATRLGLCSYNECDTYDLQMESRLAICLNSLGKLTANAPLQSYDIVIIDEIEQVLARLTTKIDQKPLVFRVLQHVMQHAKTLICLDAHLSKATVQLIQTTCPMRSVTVHVNHHVQDTERGIVLHDSPESVQLAAMQALDKGQTAYLTFNSKSDAQKTFEMLKAAFPDKQGLCISSDNAGDDANQAFFKDVNGESQRYDYLVCTPSVSTGVSIDNNHFDFVGGIFLSNINTANDCMQALGRVRDKDVRHVYCDRRQANHPLDPDTIMSRWQQTHDYDLALMNLTNEGARVVLNDDYQRLCLSITQNRNASRNDFYQQFALLALHERIALTYFEDEPDITVRKEFRQLKKSIMETESEKIGAAPLSDTAIALRELLSKPRKTMEDTLSAKKQALIEFYNLPPDDVQAIQALATLDNDNKFKQRLQLLELALGDDALAKQRFLNQTERSEQFAADVTHFASLQQLYRFVLGLLHLTTTHGLLNTADYRYTQESLIQNGFIDYIEANRSVLKGLLSLPSPAQLQKDPIRFIGMLLSRLGLKQKRVGKSEKGTYHLDEARTALLNSLITRRRAGFTGVSMPLDTTSVLVKKPVPLDVLSACLNGIKRFFQPNSTVFSGFCFV